LIFFQIVGILILFSGAKRHQSSVVARPSFSIPCRLPAADAYVDWLLEGKKRKSKLPEINARTSVDKKN
jgi:hypothetical protein